MDLENSKIFFSVSTLVAPKVRVDIFSKIFLLFNSRSLFCKLVLNKLISRDPIKFLWLHKVKLNTKEIVLTVGSTSFGQKQLAYRYLAYRACIHNTWFSS